jgi:glutathionylspermidine synthase
MKRLDMAPRPDWPARVASLGLTWHSQPDGTPYWDESAAWAFTPAQVAALEAATAELYRLYIAAGQHVIDTGRLAEFGIPAFCHRAIREAWEGEPRAPNLGRFDLGWTGEGPPKLFEFNADTPTSLLEAAVIQWDWLEQVMPGHDQFNSLHDTLVARWTEIAPPPGTSRLYLAHAREASGEDAVTTAYMADAANAAGIDCALIAIEDIGWDPARRRFVDLDGLAMDAIWKLYPWEWLLADDFGKQVVESLDTTLWMEPIWKLLWSNKAMLAVLWELFPSHPNLLETRRQPLHGPQVKKPILGREGANVTVLANGPDAPASATRPGDYGREGFVWQALYDLPGSGQQRPVIGSWVVDGAPAGIGIREDGPITGNLARFVPHVIMG